MVEILGIDPGKTGAVALKTESSVEIQDCPTIEIGKTKKGNPKFEPDPFQMAKLVQSYKARYPDLICVIEVQSMRAHEGSKSTFHTGEWFGYWIGILAALDIEIILVNPQDWKRHYNLPGGKDKEPSRLLAIEKYPEMANYLKRKKDHGRAEALLIAEYGVSLR